MEAEEFHQQQLEQQEYEEQMADLAEQEANQQTQRKHK